MDGRKPTARRPWRKRSTPSTDQPLGYRINIFLARLCFRGIYFPLMGTMAWLKVVAQNRRTILKLAREAFFGRRSRPTDPDVKDAYEPMAVPDVTSEVTA